MFETEQVVVKLTPAQAQALADSLRGVEETELPALAISLDELRGAAAALRASMRSRELIEKGQATPEAQGGPQ